MSGGTRARELHRRIHNVVWKAHDDFDDDDAGLIADDVIEALGSVRERALDLAEGCTDEQLVALRNIWADVMNDRRAVREDQP